MGELPRITEHETSFPASRSSTGWTGLHSPTWTWAGGRGGRGAPELARRVGEAGVVRG